MKIHWEAADLHKGTNLQCVTVWSTDRKKVNTVPDLNNDIITEKLLGVKSLDNFQ